MFHLLIVMCMRLMLCSIFWGKSMQVEQTTVFQKLKQQRMMMGIVAMAVSYGMVFLILGIKYTPRLTSDRGMDISWEVWDGSGWWKILLIGAVIFFSTMSSNESLKDGKSIRQIHPKTDKKQLSIVFPSHLSEQLIVDATLELAKEMRVEVSGIYIGENPIPNAFTTFALEEGNTVLITSNLLMILDEQSIRAVIAHELGHIKNKDVMFKRGVLVPQLFIRLWMILLIIQTFGVVLLSTGIWQFVYRCLFFLGVVVVFFMCTGILSKVSNWYAQTKEKMADAYAVQYTSMEGMINGFVRLNDRSHTLKSFIKALQKEDKELDKTVLQEALRIFPTGNKSDEEIQEKVSSIYAQAHLQLLLKRLRVDADKNQKEQWLEQMLALQKEPEEKDEQEEQADKKEEESQAQTKDPFVWSDFDWNHDGVLQEEEIDEMVKVLRDEPNAMSDKEEQEGEHPPIRERILFLADLKDSAQK